MPQGLQDKTNLQLGNFGVKVRPVGVVRLPLESLALVEVASLDPLVERSNRFHRLKEKKNRFRCQICFQFQHD